MHPDKLLQLLEKVREKKVAPQTALRALKRLPFENLGFAKLDHHRSLRRGFPEVIYGPGKTVEQIVKLSGSLIRTGSDVFITRVDKPVYQKVKGKFPKARYFPDARAIVIKENKYTKKTGFILVVSAGTADLPVAEEAALTCEVLGNYVERLYDVGVAGLHRFLAHWDKLEKARVLIVVAGMEGALASVVAGLVDKPLIAVPTSVGYGTTFGGLSALLTMLNSCAGGVTVVSIDNGFAAGVAASMINKL